MNTQPLVAEGLSNYHRDELFIAAQDSRATDAPSAGEAESGLLHRLTDLLRLGARAHVSAAHSTAAGSHGLGN